MSRLSLGNLVVRLGFGGMDEVRELDGVLNEEDGDIVSDEIPISKLGIEFDGEASDVSDGVGRTSVSRTVEKRTNTGVLSAGRWKRSAEVRSEIFS